MVTVYMSRYSAPNHSPRGTATRNRARSLHYRLQTTEAETDPEPELSVRPSTTDRTLGVLDDPPAVSTDGLTDGQGQKGELTPSGQRLARWVGRYVPRTGIGNGALGDPVRGGAFVGAERLVRQHGARRVLGAIRMMSEERELSDGYAACWKRDIRSPAEYLVWYLRENDARAD